MKKLNLLLVSMLFSMVLSAQTIKMSKENIEATEYVSRSFVKISGKKILKVEFDTTSKDADMPSYVKIKGFEFQNGVIEVKVLSRLMKNAPATSRGFIGLAFRIDEKNSAFESIYIRPTNGRTDDQIRRNHSIQYFSYPDYKFDKLRKTEPEKYESYADMGLNEWITMRIEVEGQKAKLFLNNAKYPSLVVNDMKHGSSRPGSIGLWVGNFTEGYFKDLKIVKK
ncbi:hypothetical protein Emtol_2269 [Emticicia oligotrophica DSM 17448]|uniref:3-keto-disaccharide hydrolase domain-containing protein n=1 Tax=Emticicia oligotrophica (strain DSM 17448 / CIP 109782 / MTCC 6937 / GPTSA100-15) TaxID=929562 RepID=A0ABM5N247_EMTOG|nr:MULTISPECIES: hypothetical protein [Emticicia]AFK03407.1 hypothetical protein Emtol_2269 [Emticicia oligotrophica DSM 17448]